MIGWLQGQLADRWHLNNRFGVLLVCSGVGYEVQMPRRHWDQLGGNGTETSLHVHQVIREDSWTLYGFCARHERDLFRELVAVSGIGPQMALGLLGQLSCEELVRAIVQADLRQLCQAPGVGKRTAERLSVELRTRLQARYGESLQLSAADDLQTGEAGEGPAEGVREEVQLTLAALGYEALEINRALRALSLQSQDLGEDGDAWLRESLRYLSRDAA
ncbi:Holliday junction branch migration protein RuvA [Synechococcus sp. LTW-R]|uniref:Holliday junction branch migration protein RuvA n=1 Tax=Synechococcus sp. LTW-R TaxID=2751170 RepID=UPI00162AA78C|nr:Holliday junction branch migration protein RuvA [Synechococcus sp. LTW-R]QNG30121.1 Holliday junction branch migration protein RuvA [Synechococcus sp. LTW-R]